MSPAPDADARLRILVAIASFGTRNLALLEEVIRGWRSMPFDVHVVVVSDGPKDLGDGVEVVVGLPARNPWSLPFAHKPIFAANLDRYDLFAYSEDDMAITADHVRAFLRVTPDLAPDEIAGFLRYEVDAAGGRWFPDIHAHFHWKPESVGRRAEHVIAELSNEHAAFYLLSRDQLARAIASGGFLRAPYEGRYDMLCTVATDPYTTCGFRKVVAVSALESFAIHHLSNRYAGRMGVPLAAVQEQIQALFGIAAGTLRTSRLLHTESGFGNRKWSTPYHDPADEAVASLVPRDARTVLSVGCGWGATEARIREGGRSVTALPLDGVVAASAAARGAEVVLGTLEEALQELEGRSFDCILIADLLHLAPDPAKRLAQLSPFVGPGGSVVVRSPNFSSLRVLAKRALRRDELGKLGSFNECGVHPLGPASLKRYLRSAGFRVTAMRWPARSARKSLDRSLGRWGAPHWLLQARRLAV
ncbi:MAG: methyltransferase domain-containing protein [bacterium]